MFFSLLSWVFLQISATPRTFCVSTGSWNSDRSIVDCTAREGVFPTRGWMKAETNGGVLRVGLNDNSFWGGWRLLLETSGDHSFSFKRFFVFVEVPNKHDLICCTISKVTRNIVSLMTHLECHPGIQMTLGWGLIPLRRQEGVAVVLHNYLSSLKHLKGRLPDLNFRSNVFV